MSSNGKSSRSEILLSGRVSGRSRRRVSGLRGAHDGCVARQGTCETAQQAKQAKFMRELPGARTVLQERRGPFQGPDVQPVLRLNWRCSIWGHRLRTEQHRAGGSPCAHGRVSAQCPLLNSRRHLGHPECRDKPVHPPSESMGLSLVTPAYRRCSNLTFARKSTTMSRDSEPQNGFAPATRSHPTPYGV